MAFEDYCRQRRGRSLSFLAVILGLAPAVACPEDGPQELAAATARYLHDRRQFVAGYLDLKPAEAAKFWPLYEQLQHDLTLLREKRRALIGEFGENYDDMSDAMARKLTLDQINYEEERARLVKSYFTRFERALPPKQLARFFQLETKIQVYVDAGITETLPLIK